LAGVSALGARAFVLRRGVLLAGVTVTLLVLTHWLSPGGFQPPQMADRRPTHGAPLTYPAALTRADQMLEGAHMLEQTRAGEWMVQERVANTEIDRARLTGSFDDYVAAQQALDRAFAEAPKGSGPHITQAALDFSLHKLTAAERMLDAIDHYAIPADAEVRIDARATRGDIAFYRGHYADALKVYTSSAGSGEPGDSFRLAVYQGKTGQIDEALKSLDRTERNDRFPSAQFLANLELQRGALELQRGALDRASRDFSHADRIFPGYWLAQAHCAQMLALTGKRQDAIARFEAIAAKNPVPEVMDALAALYRAQGDYAHSKFWSDRAGAIWETRLQQIPEAAWGHAIEHYLAFGEPARALDLAQRDYTARPYAASAIALAWAYLANNRPADALRVIAPVQASPWVSADQHIVAAQAHTLLGQSDAADAEQQKALAINPHSLDRDAALIWFGHS